MGDPEDDEGSGDYEADDGCGGNCMVENCGQCDGYMMNSDGTCHFCNYCDEGFIKTQPTSSAEVCVSVQDYYCSDCTTFLGSECLQCTDCDGDMGQTCLNC